MDSAQKVSASKGLAWAVAGSAAFTFAIWFLNYRLTGLALQIGQPGAQRIYPWMLAERRDWAQFTAWLGYALHQILFWRIIWRAQKAGTRFSSSLRSHNWQAFAVTAGFISLHFLHTHIFYDGLAPDVPEWTAMWSVIIMLLVIILMENRRRGLAFGIPWGGFVADASAVARRYHGYFFAWAAIYTFWYHPMVSTPGHLLGFFYMFLLFTQGSLLYSRAHTNKWWTVFLEVLVMIHGVTVAIVGADGAWHMFGFGLAGVFVVTQGFGLGWQRSVSWTLVAIYTVALLGFYSQWGWQDLIKPFRILGGYYVALPVLAAVIWGAGRLLRIPAKSS